MRRYSKVSANRIIYLLLSHMKLFFPQFYEKVLAKHHSILCGLRHLRHISLPDCFDLERSGNSPKTSWLETFETYIFVWLLLILRFAIGTLFETSFRLRHLWPLRHWDREVNRLLQLVIVNLVFLGNEAIYFMTFFPWQTKAKISIEKPEDLM